MKNTSLLVILAAVTVGGPVYADMTLRSEPTYVPFDAAGHGGHGHRRAPEVHLRSGEGSAVRLWTPELEEREIEPEEAERILIKPTGLNSYHALVAIREDGGATEVAMRYFYFNGKPATKTPSALVAAEKAVLEIVPDPLPREHWRYLSGEPVRFLIRYRGTPLGEQTVSLYTSNGTLLEGRTDGEGRWEVVLPDDFVDVRTGRSHNRPGDFVVRTALVSEGHTYRTTLNASYSVNPSHWQSTGLGGLVLAAGFLTGLIVLRRAGRGGEA